MTTGLRVPLRHVWGYRRGLGSWVLGGSLDLVSGVISYNKYPKPSCK